MSRHQLIERRISAGYEFGAPLPSSQPGIGRAVAHGLELPAQRPPILLPEPLAYPTQSALLRLWTVDESGILQSVGKRFGQVKSVQYSWRGLDEIAGERLEFALLPLCPSPELCSRWLLRLVLVMVITMEFRSAGHDARG